MLTWHGLAKLRMHTDHTITLLREATTRLGKELRSFVKDVCPRYDTRDTPRESEKKARNNKGKKKATSKGADHHAFTIATSKIHALGDYVDEIVRYGTTDGYSTQLVRSISSFMSLHQFVLFVG